MIARHWRGWTSHENADKYEALLRNQIMPAIRRIRGCKGGYLLRRNPTSGETAETEFVVIHMFESLHALQAFAGPDYAKAVIEPEARALLCRTDDFAVHYEITVNTLDERPDPER